MFTPTDFQLTVLLVATEFDVDKCAFFYVKKGRFIEYEGINLSGFIHIRFFSVRETNKNQKLVWNRRSGTVL